MKAFTRTALAILVTSGACQPVLAMTEDGTSVADLMILTVDDEDDLVEAELKIEAWLDEGSASL